MDIIMELIMSIILEGTLESITEKKIPVFIRVIMAVLLLGFYMGFGGCLIYIGIKNDSVIIVGIAIFVLVMVACVAVKKYREIRH